MSIVASLVAAQRAQDLHAICDAIDAVVTALRRHELTEEEMDAGGECLLALAESRRWEVRRSVAAALRHVRGGAVDSTLRRLRADEVARVKQAAEESIQRRAERKQLDLLPILGDEELERLLAAADKKSPHGRRAALRAGTAYAQFIVRGQNHEVARAITQANTSLMILEQSLDGPARERVRGFREKLRHINAIHDDARIYVMNERPEYTPQDVQAHVDETIAFARGLPIAQANGLEAQVDVEPGLKVDGEYDLVRRAFDNVVKNAVEASEGTRPVQLTVTAHSV
jgi:signal transduction histidine kinase